MFNLGAGELLLIIVIALLVFGPARLPQVARTIGKANREFRRMSQIAQTDILGALEEQETEKASKTPSGAAAEVEATPRRSHMPNSASQTPSQPNVDEG
jgi:Tat protein translocase TatB subunit